MPNTTANSGSLIPEAVAQLLVQPLEAASVVLASGVQVFDTAEPLRIPKLTGGTTVGLVGESELIPTDTVDFGHISLMPSVRKSFKILTRFSNELLRQSAIGLDAALKVRLVGDVARALDQALLTGTGADNGITGIIHQPGVQTGELDVTDPDSLLDAMALASAAEVTPNKWFINGADFIALRKLKETTGSRKYLLEADIHNGPTYRLLGVETVVTNKLPQGTAVLANTAEIAVARDIDPTVTLLSERFAEYDEQGIRVVTRYDLGLLHPEGVIVLTDAA